MAGQRLDGDINNNKLDAVSFGLSNDTLYGYAGNDTLYGWQGDDFLAGGEDNDLLYGEDGNDTLVGGPGNDTLIGGNGDDTYHVDSVYDVVTEYAFQGTDTVRSRIHYALGANLENLELDGTDNLTGGGNDLNNIIKGNSGNNNLLGAAGDDVIIGGLGNDTVFGGTGFDSVSYSGGYATYNAYFTSDGAVRIIGSEGTDYLYDVERINFGDGGFYNVYTGDGNSNSLTADPGVWSMLFGGGGNDILTGGNGNDTLIGGNGNDNIFGGNGFDIAGYFGQYTSYNASFNSNGSVKITGSEGTDTLSGIERIYFADGAYYAVQTGDGGNNTITANYYDHTMLFGGGGNDTLTGSKFHDTLNGGDGNDSITGGLGNDIIIGGTGTDTAYYAEANFVYNVSLTSTGAVNVTAGEGTDTLTGVERINFSNGAYYNVRVGDDTDNSFTANPGVLTLLYGGGGNDTLNGSIYNDDIAGGTGNDVLVGGNGSDILSGGSGADKFRFAYKSDGIDLIKDFNRGEGDKIEIVKSTFGATSLSEFSYNSTTGALSFGSTQLATLQNKPSSFSVQTDVVLV